MNFKKYMNSDYLKSNPLCGIDTYKDELNLATGACTRRIKKLVLDGTENWKKRTYNDAIHTFELNLDSRIIKGLCSHYAGYLSANIDKVDGIYLSNTSAIIITDLRFTTPADFKSYLAQQYTNGTPVIVWYVLTEPTTETITVPSGLSGIVEGSLTQTGTPTPSNPIYPTANTVEKWFDLNHYVMGTDTDILTTLPDVVYVNDTTVTVGLKGQMSQTGTPTPTTPIQPQECGERTGNLWDGNYENGVLNTDGTLNSPNFNYSTTTYILTEKENYTLSVVCNYDSGPRLLRICFYDENKNFISCIDSPQFRGVSFFYEFNFTAPSNSKYLRFSYIVRSGVSDTNIMLNTGSTALPYENFGYKIPILSANTTTPVYLGEVETTRRIKKLVLTGDESWSYAISNAPFRLNLTEKIQVPLPTIVFWVCSHYEAVSNSASWVLYDSCISWSNNDEGSGLRFRDIRYSNLDDFKAYIAQQYANGTPVCVWYVLATPTTGIVNEPLRKIGDYADEVSGITIPTIAGANTLSIGTTLQPSEVTATYKGWHPVQSVHERENGAWT